MSLDIGDRTVGIAVSDELLFTAQGVETIRRKSYKHDLARIRELSKQYETKKFVVGLPKNMNNTEGPRVEASKAYGDQIKELFNIPVDYQDERLTTVQAERMLVEQADVSRGKRKKVIDKLAAQLILQNYLDRMF